MLNTCSGMFYEKSHMSDSISVRSRGECEHHHVVCLSSLTSGRGCVECGREGQEHRCPLYRKMVVNMLSKYFSLRKDSYERHSRV